MSRPASSEELVRWVDEDVEVRRVLARETILEHRIGLTVSSAFLALIGLVPLVSVAFGSKLSVSPTWGVVIGILLWVVSFAFGAVALRTRRWLDAVEVTPHVGVSSTVEDGMIVRSISVGGRSWREYRSIPAGEEAYALVARHAVEDGSLGRRLADGLLSPTVEDPWMDEFFALLEEGRDLAELETPRSIGPSDSPLSEVQSPSTAARRAGEIRRDDDPRRDRVGS